jgi:hypothetical protein
MRAPGSRPHQNVTPATSVRLPIRLIPGLLVSLLPATAAAQASPFRASIAAYAVPVWTRVDRIPGNRDLDETRVVQPVIMARASAWNRLSLQLTIDFEGKTIPDGELMPGAFGEGFMDRRHPHTYLHEAMLTGDDVLGGWDGPARVSLSLGKGFVAFGTDDPMSRPPLRYPVNHHYSQILERAVGILGVGYGPVTLEGSLFNGDEPEKPSQWPLLDRFGDSWALRLTLRPIAPVELQGSIAEVHSPEHRGGTGLDHSKTSLSARWEGGILRVPTYFLGEFARESEGDGFFIFKSYLLEGQVAPGPHRAYFRWEQTERPEETRTADRFHSVRPHIDNSLVGITRWSIHTLGYGFVVGPFLNRLRLTPFAEVSYSKITLVSGIIFRPEFFYGDDQIWSTSFGLRIDWGMGGHRMGRYGVATPSAMAHHEM